MTSYFSLNETFYKVKNDKVFRWSSFNWVLSDVNSNFIRSFGTPYSKGKFLKTRMLDWLICMYFISMWWHSGQWSKGYRLNCLIAIYMEKWFKINPHRQPDNFFRTCIANDAEMCILYSKLSVRYAKEM